MSRIEARFRALRERGKPALMPFVSAGDPSLEATEALVLAMQAAGADLIEIGVPFSDPIADGPTIQRSSMRGLQAGASLRRVLTLVRSLRPKVSIPLLLMGYANPFYAMGVDGFAQAASEAGVDGVIIPDLPPEEGADLYAACRAHGVAPVLLAAPTTSDARLERLARETRGFLYYVSLTGVTGARSELASGIEARVRAAQRMSATPVCVGIGISTPEQAKTVGRYADGIVVGSAIVQRIEAAPSQAAAIEAVAEFVGELARALESISPRKSPAAATA